MTIGSRMSAQAKKSPAGWDAIDALIKDERALEAGRLKLADAALRCFVENGYSNTSVQDIAAAAGVSIGSVYKYVRAKEDVLWLISEAGIERTRDALRAAFDGTADPPERLVAAVEAAIRQANVDRDLILLMYVEFQYMPETSKRRLREREVEIVKHFEDVIEAGNASGQFHCDHPRSAAVTIDMFSSTWVLKPYLLHGVGLTNYIAEQQTAALRLVGAGTKSVTAFSRAASRSTR
jgi:AcrR family transcriptional regulator